MAQTTEYVYKLKGGDAEVLKVVNPFLERREPIVVFLQDGKVNVKVGDGRNSYNDLPFISTDSIDVNNVEGLKQILTSYEEDIHNLNIKIDNIVIDRTYDSTSENAQSGKAVAEALTDYVKNTDYANTNGGAGIVALNKEKGIFRANLSPVLEIVGAQNNDIVRKTNSYKPITPYYLDYAVKVGITTNTKTLTDEEKAAAQNWLGVMKAPSKDAGGYMIVPVVNHLGEQTTVKVSYNPLGYALVPYHSGGVIKTNAPKVENDCANKAYVDSALGDIEAAFDELHNYAQALINGGTTI